MQKLETAKNAEIENLKAEIAKRNQAYELLSQQNEKQV